MKKSKVVLDTNVLISGLFWMGNSHKILIACKSKKLHLIISPALLQELKSILEREKKFGLTQKELERIVKTMAEIAKLVFPFKRLDIIKIHPSDNRVLECAEKGKADYIISGDKHLTNLKTYKWIKILKPAKAVELLLP